MRVFSWALHMALPLLGLWLLLTPRFDVVLRHNPSHFWIVVVVAAFNLGLGARMSSDARRRGDTRLFLVAMAFLASAGFLGLHALATPQVLLASPNGGFALATPVGLALAAVFAALSSVPWRASGAAIRAQAWARIGLVVLLVGWGVVSLLGLPPLAQPVDPGTARRSLGWIAAGGCVLYVVAAARYFTLYRRRPSAVLLSVITAFVLLAEAMVAVAISESWHAAWWEWHVLMLIAFGFVAYSARVQYVREGSSAGLFDSLALDETITRLRREYSDALEQLVEAVRRQADTGVAQPVDTLAARVGERFDLTERQTEVLGRSAEALASEREQIERLDALVAVGRQATVIQDEQGLLERALSLAGPTFRRDVLRVGLLEDGTLRYLDAKAPRTPSVPALTALSTLEPVESGNGDGLTLILPLQVKGHPAGVLELHRPAGTFADRERAVLRSLASQLSIAVENARLYQQLDGLFRSYMSPAVATALIADPGQAALGGELSEVTVLFADLQGFTPFAERTPPDQVVALLNRYFGLVVPLILAEGGTVVQFVGDEVMALFNAPVRQPDHALRAARAGLALQRAVGELLTKNPDWPGFRVGVNTGTALVGNIGSPDMRNFTAIGDTTNLAARLQAEASVGEVVLGPATYAQIQGAADVQPIGPLSVKGKAEPILAYVLLGLRDRTVQG